MTGLLEDQTVLVVGRGSGFAQAIVLAARDAGANAAADAQARSPALELAPIRVNAISPVRRIGTTDDIAQAVMLP